MHMDSYLLSPDILRTKDQSLKSDRRSLNMNEGMSGFCMKSRCGGGGGGGRKCGRWNPTTEQVKVLTDLFQSGLRTPSTDQIQKISSQLSFYGKIESKNVFYWFQNHKARERQKRRRVSAVDQQNEMHGEDKMSSRKHFTEINQVTEHERVMKTLQLFPLSSLQESESEKLRLFANECRERKSLSCAAENDMDHYPPLDLRLSFL